MKRCKALEDVWEGYIYVTFERVRRTVVEDKRKTDVVRVKIRETVCEKNVGKGKRLRRNGGVLKHEG